MFEKNDNIDVNTNGMVHFESSGQILINNERISYVSKTANSFQNCSRGAYGTAPDTHAQGSKVYSIKPGQAFDVETNRILENQLNLLWASY